MSWNRFSEDQLFTHNRISAGTAGLFSIEDDERALRDAWHTNAIDLRQCVLKRTLISLIKPEARPARRATTAAARTHVWLTKCADEAVDEVGELARRKDAPQLVVKVLRTRASAKRDGLCQDLDAGARIIGVASDHDLELSELAGHLIFIPSRGAGRQEDASESSDDSEAGRALTPDGNSETGDYYILLANPKSELELFGLQDVRWGLLPPLPAALPPPPRTQTRVAKSKTTVATRSERARHASSNYFDCLQGDEARITAQALANYEAFHALAPGTATEHQVARSLAGIQGWAAADRDAELVEEVDLHGCTAAEAIEQVAAVLDKHAPSATAGRGSKVRQRHVHFVVGRGKHSEDGIAQIKPRVERELRKRCVRHGTVRNNPGVVWADVETIQPFRAGEYELTLQDFGYIGDILHLLVNVERLLRRGMFPRITDALAAPQFRLPLPATLFKGRCSFKELKLPDICNKHQAEAIGSIQHNLSAIQGPPGTGKTMLIATILEHGVPHLTALVTCVQNKALEPIAQRLAEQGVNFVVCGGQESVNVKNLPGGGGIGFGVGASGRMLACADCSAAPAGDVDVGFGADFGAFDTAAGSEKRKAVDKLGAVCRDHSLAALASREMPPTLSEAVCRLARVIMGPTRRLMVGRLFERIVMRRLTEAWRAEKESEILAKTTVFLSTIDRAFTVHKLLYELRRPLDVVIVDEAGAVPEWKMPTLAACGGGGNDSRGGPELIILVGDQKQLPPFSHNRDVTPTSVLEKMANALPSGSVKMLRNQHRMPPEICDFISSRFYGGDLTTAGQKLEKVSQDCRRSKALEWIDYAHARESLEGTSLYNDTELDIIVDLLTSRAELAFERLDAESETVMVITFYAAQARRLQERLHAKRPDVLVMTVDSAQGSETDYVILSCVRCNGGHDIGRFVADDRRVNVAMSRARKQLIVVGSSKTLVRTCSRSQHDLWRSFKEHTDALLAPPACWEAHDKYGGREVDLRLTPERRFTDDEMEELARQLPELPVFKSPGRTVLSIKVDCAERGFGDRGMKALCRALIRIHRPKMRAKLFFYKLRLTDASMPHVAEVLERYQGMVVECHLSHNDITNTGARQLLVEEVVRHYPSPGRHNMCQPLWLRLEQCRVNGRNLDLPGLPNHDAATSASKKDWMYTPEKAKMKPQQSCPAVQMPHLDLPVPPADAHLRRPPGS